MTAHAVRRRTVQLTQHEHTWWCSSVGQSAALSRQRPRVQVPSPPPERQLPEKPPQAAARDLTYRPPRDTPAHSPTLHSVQVAKYTGSKIQAAARPPDVQNNLLRNLSCWQAQVRKTAVR